MQKLVLPAAMLIVMASAQPPPVARLAVPVEPIDAIVAAFELHDVVALADLHDNVQDQVFKLSLIGDPRFSATDIVVEWGNALHQELVDRYVRGEHVADDALRRVWRDTTQPQAGRSQAPAEFLRAVRAVNASRSAERQLRVLLGDPPINWDHVQTRDDYQRFLYQRDTYPAQLIERETLARGRHALVLYGGMHLQRHNLFSNYELVDDSQLHTLVQQLERRSNASVLTVWVDARTQLDALQSSVGAWPIPSLTYLDGTLLGAEDFAVFYDTAVSRLRMQDGRMVPVPEEEWGQLAMEDQFDALLYLGPPSGMTASEPTPELCDDPEFMATRRARLTLVGMLPVLEELARWCRENSR